MIRFPAGTPWYRTVPRLRRLGFQKLTKRQKVIIGGRALPTFLEGREPSWLQRSPQRHRGGPRRPPGLPLSLPAIVVMVVVLLRVPRVRREQPRLLRLTTHKQWRLQQRLATAQHQRTPHWPPRGQRPLPPAAGGRRPRRSAATDCRTYKDREVGRAIDEARRVTRRTKFWYLLTPCSRSWTRRVNTRQVPERVQ
jgi:hypothetical protein